MEPLTDPRLQPILNTARVEHGPGAGRALRFATQAARTIVVQLVVTDFPAHASAVLRAVLGCADSWVLIARYGHVPVDLLPVSQAPVAAVRFTASEAAHVGTCLADHGPPPISGSDDVYLIADDGGMFLTWDHHWDEGIAVDCIDVRRASALLVALNELGAELELYSTSPPR